MILGKTHTDPLLCQGQTITFAHLLLKKTGLSSGSAHTHKSLSDRPQQRQNKFPSLWPLWFVLTGPAQGAATHSNKHKIWHVCPAAIFCAHSSHNILAVARMVQLAVYQQHHTRSAMTTSSIRTDARFCAEWIGMLARRHTCALVSDSSLSELQQLFCGITMLSQNHFSSWEFFYITVRAAGWNTVIHDDLQAQMKQSIWFACL